MTKLKFAALSIGVALCFFLAARLLNNEYVFFAGYTILQYVVLATAWNILGGYCGYVNFGAAAFFALGAYTTVAIEKAPALAGLKGTALASLLTSLPIPVLMCAGGLVAGIVGLIMGAITLRLRGVFFSIATLALSVVLYTFVVNIDFLGGSRGAFVLRPASIGFMKTYMEYLFLVMLLLAALALNIARWLERSKAGLAFAVIRDDELAADASGVPTLKVKLFATALSGALMGMAGAPLPYYVGYLQPVTAFGLDYSVNAIAMSMIGGTTSWVGPLIGAIVVSGIQQIATVTISSVANLLVVGLLLTVFVVAAPKGIIGFFARPARKLKAEPRKVTP